GFAESNVGQYCFSLFAVMAMALTASWFVAIIFAPVIGVTVLPERIAKTKEAGLVQRGRGIFRWLLLACMRHRYIMIVATLALFALALGGQSLVQRQFFP